MKDATDRWLRFARQDMRLAELALSEGSTFRLAIQMRCLECWHKGCLDSATHRKR